MTVPTTSAETRAILTAAIDAACVSRGPRKGQLKASCPPSGTHAAAAWQAIVGHANPYKMSIFAQMCFSDEQREIYRLIDEACAGTDCRGFDRDRVALEKMGVW